ncbi:RDD family protein [Hymenobacter sp. J193]|uniref:RDD family protein n=1 Tax=Hymenobacter sp. J193 TaxID=2898429 RepID=UPI002150A027|nr:RDD family protein [Hymenobacter sp. J193]MCR5888995.1 RDD family protein [Hymenobacter sp. J193]
MSTIRVQTTQNVSLEYETASVGERILATIIDYLVLFAWIIVLFLLLSWLEPGKNVMIGLGIVLMALPYLLYDVVCEVFFNGQTIGKKARHIKVIRIDGTTPRFGDYLLRWLLRPIDVSLMYGLVAIIAIVAGGKGQRLGDMAAGTAVISTKPRQPGGALAPQFPQASYVVVFPQASLLADHDVATIRQLLYKGLERENYLLLNEVANKVKNLTGIQTEIPDEAFLRTIIRDHAHLASGE